MILEYGSLLHCQVNIQGYESLLSLILNQVIYESPLKVDSSCWKHPIKNEIW